MDKKVVSVYTTPDEIEANRVAQTLAQHGIDSHIHNARPQDLFGMGRLGTGFNPLVGQIEVQILENQKEKALAILKDELGIIEPEDDKHIAAEPDTTTQEVETKRRQIGDATRSIVLSVAWLFGIGSLLGIYFGIRGYKHQPVLSAFGIFFGVAGLPLLLWVILSLV